MMSVASSAAEAAAASRRKQAKPQKVAGGDKVSDESVNLMLTENPESIEEQFRKQLFSSLDHQKAFFTAGAEALKQLNHIDENDNNEAGGVVVEDPKLAMVSDKTDLLINGLSHLNQQQLLQLCAASLAGNKDLLKQITVASFAPTTDTVPLPPALTAQKSSTSSTAAVALTVHHEVPCAASVKSSASIASSTTSCVLRCPAEGCGYKSAAKAQLLLHLSSKHKGEYLNCDSCGECFGDLIEFRRHRCGSELPATRPASVSAKGGDIESDSGTEFVRHTASVPSLPQWTTGNSFQLRNAEQQFADVEGGSSGTSSPDSDMDTPRELGEPPLLLNELFGGNLPGLGDSGGAGNILDLSSKSSMEKQLVMMGGFIPKVPFGHPSLIASQSPFETPNTSFPSPANSSTASTSLINDDDWESMMEISNTDENEKIRQLVGDKAAPPTDPNQCLLCRRVLSCKSALQMHYRTHTGERPFKCKICQRAFTTKGNLKTHMGVHRTKHSIRTMPGSLQQCPICAKRFVSGVQLSQHLTSHARLGIDSDGGNVVQKEPKGPVNNNMPPTSSPFQLFPNFLGLPGFPGAGNGSLPLNLAANNFTGLSNQSKVEEARRHLAQVAKEELKRTTLVSEATAATTLPNVSTASTIKAPYVVPTFKREAPSSTPESSTSSSVDVSPVKQPRLSTSEATTMLIKPDSDSTTGDSNPLDAIQRMWRDTEPATPVLRAPVTLSKHQCAVCFKHFSSSSALQIHMRTHTGDKPFKCTVCGRAFTTRGNLKVHMGTHSFSQSPSRRGRRIFDFAPELAVRQQLMTQMTAAVAASPSVSSAGPFGMLNPLSFSPLLAAAFAAQQQQHQANANANQRRNSTTTQSVHKSPISPTSNVESPPSPSVISTPTLDSMFMMLRTVCTICQKTCSSPSELESHLKTHLSMSESVSNGAIQLKSE